MVQKEEEKRYGHAWSVLFLFLVVVLALVRWVLPCHGEGLTLR